MGKLKCLVTGNHGFIGHLLVNKLLYLGHDVTGLDCDYFPTTVFAHHDLVNSSSHIPQLRVDIRDLRSKDLTGFDAVLHLAALPNDPASYLSPSVTEDINFLATFGLATEAKRAGVKRFIYASSCSVYGANGERLINENSRVAPLTPYAISKLNSEISLLLMSSEDFAVTIMRNATCYGASPRMRFDMVLNNFIGYAVTEGKIKIFSDGSAWRPLVHVEDVAESYSIALEAEVRDVCSQIFSIGSQNYKISDLAYVAQSVSKDSEIEFVPGGQRDNRSYRINFSKAEKILGFRPKWTAIQGAKEVLDACRSFGLNRENFKDRMFWADKNFEYLREKSLIDPSFRFVERSR